MKKSIVIAALIFVLASFVNETIGVSAGALMKPLGPGNMPRLTVKQQTREGFSDAEGSFVGFKLRHVAPIKALRVFNEAKEEPPEPTEAEAGREKQETSARPVTRPTTTTASTTPQESTSPTTTTTTTTTTSRTTSSARPSTTTTTTKAPTTTTTKPPTTTTTTTKAPTTTTKPVTTTTTTAASQATSGSRGYYCSDFEAEVVRLVNIERAAHGACPVTMNSSLRSSAAVRALEIIDKFSHERPDGTRWVTAIRIKYACAGENLAAGQRTPANVVNAWMNSEGHRKNLLNPKYTEIGVACYHDPDSTYKYYWGQLFAGYSN